MELAGKNFATFVFNIFNEVEDEIKKKKADEETENNFRELQSLKLGVTYNALEEFLPKF